MRNKFFAAVFFSGLVFAATAQQQEWKGRIEKSIQQSTPYKIDYVKKAVPGSPSVLLILLDDVGFGASEAFGGLVHTPNLDSLANNGLRYVNFHTAGICSPTRAALLTGRNHHYVGMGMFPHYHNSADFPGYNAHIPSKDGTIAEVLHANGYATYQLGKWHLTPDEDTTDLGPFDRWPSGKGFDHNFGFLGGSTDQYKPKLVEDNKHVQPDGRHLNAQLVDKAISYLSYQQAKDTAKPFFMYFATGATHAPHQVDTAWSNRYKGRFDEGWDVYREKVFENQKKLGVIPSYAQLPARNELIHAWKDLPAEEQHLYARFMEVYAGYLEYTDYEIGRLIGYLRTSGQLANTIVLVIVGDNGASKEGTEYGITTKGSRSVNGTLTREEYRQIELSNYGKIGEKDVAEAANYPLGWAQACNTPFRYWKSDANAEGATHNPLIVYYPGYIKEKGGIRWQYGHVIDIFPTIEELISIKQPENIKGIKQDTLQGFSLVYSLNNKEAKSVHTEQYYTIYGNRAIYKDGWKAEAAHHPNGIDLFAFTDDPKKDTTDNPDKDVWQLYNLNDDFNERIDIAEKYPDKLKELKVLYDKNASKYYIYPLLDFKYTEDKIKAAKALQNNSKSK
ncbi:arylsulfatase [Parafilimonas sp.]|uniref:arylsulfatase n=1 Tax=Parafilimonas sp. TaxID=1969739 RepID=UPI0039E3CDFA